MWLKQAFPQRRDKWPRTVWGDASCLMIWEAQSHNEVGPFTPVGVTALKNKDCLSSQTKHRRLSWNKPFLPEAALLGCLTTAAAMKSGLPHLRTVKWCACLGKMIAIAQKPTVKLEAGAVVTQWQSPNTQLWTSPCCDKGSRIKHQGRGLRFAHLHSQLPGAPLQPVQMNPSKNTLWSSKTTSGYASKSLFISYFHGCFKHNSQGWNQLMRLS